MKVSAILLAAGGGKRMRMGIPKAFIRINGRYMFLYSLEALHKCRAIHEIIITFPDSLSDKQLRRAESKLSHFKKAKIMRGGKERHDSVKIALAHTQDTDFVLIHDSARPLINARFIGQMIKSALKYGSCVAGRILNESIKKYRGNRLTRNLSRNGIFIAETPQIFKAAALIKCMHKLKVKSKMVTDDSFILLANGLPVHFIDTNFNNVKVTTAKDLILAGNLLGNSRG